MRVLRIAHSPNSLLQYLAPECNHIQSHHHECPCSPLGKSGVKEMHLLCPVVHLFTQCRL